MSDSETHFGFEKVPFEDKARRVGDVFDSVADSYDVMNDLMSFGIHRLWKRFTVAVSGVRRGQRVLDLAGGTGDLTRLLAARVGREGLVVMADVNAAMVERGRRRLLDRGVAGNVVYLRANAERLPFQNDCFDYVCIAFGLRNVTQKEEAIAAMHGILRPGGKLAVLEFSTPTIGALRPLYDAYSFNVLPLLGRAVVGDSGSYRYLAESIRMHPDQETLKEMMVAAGFSNCDYLNLSAGIVALHQGYKL